MALLCLGAVTELLLCTAVVSRHKVMRLLNNMPKGTDKAAFFLLRPLPGA